VNSIEYTNYESLSLRRERGVAFVTINHPPMNMLDVPLVNELTTFLDEAEKDDAVRVVVFDSADPDYFLALYDAQDLVHQSGEPREN
jgi:enoyl-CoA hydratase/carnithine racemase